MNEHYLAITSMGYQLDVTTSNKNKGNMFLMRDGKVLHRVAFRTHGKGTTAILEKLPTCYRHGALSQALQELKSWIEHTKVNPISAAPTDSFATYYNETINKFSPQVLAKIHQVQQDNPSLTFEKLYRIWSVEMLYLAKTDNKEWVMS